MRRIILALAAGLLAVGASADDHKDAKAEVRAALEKFNTAYETNDVETYFAHYADDANVYFYGARQDVGAYHEEWTEMVEAGGGVEKNAISEVMVQVMPGGDIAVTSYFVDYRSRSPEGEISTAKGYESEVWRKQDGKWQIVKLHYSEIPAE